MRPNMPLIASEGGTSFWAVWVTPGVTRAAFGSSALRRGVRALPTSENQGRQGAHPPGLTARAIQTCADQ